MTEHDHDALIDAAARSFTRGNPRHDLRRVVAARLDRHASPAAFSWIRAAAFSRFAVAATGVAAIAVGFLLTRAPIEEAQKPGTRPLPLASAAPRAETTTAGTATGETGGGAARPPAPRRARTAPMTAAEQAWTTRTVPALARPDAVTVTPIQPEAVTIAQLDLKPLTIAPIGATDDGGD